MPKVYIYVVDRDLGFAPNPFHGYCSLATCKPRIRSKAQVNDWIIGVGGKRLTATGKCIFAMKVTRKVTYNEYWQNPEFRDKRPVRNGTPTMMVGDNIYFNDNDGNWHQAHSHHSLPDGNINEYNLKHDTQSNFVLLSKHFYYFGKEAPIIPLELLEQLGYENSIGHRVYDFGTAQNLISWLEENFKNDLNCIVADPFDFESSDFHYSVETNKMNK